MHFARRADGDAMRRWLSDWLIAAGLGALAGLAAVALSWPSPDRAPNGAGNARPGETRRSPRATDEPPCVDPVQRLTTTAVERTPASAVRASTRRGARNAAACGRAFDNREYANE